MKIYYFNGNKIEYADAEGFINKTLFCKNITNIKISDEYGAEAPTIIRFSVGRKTSKDKLVLKYKFRTIECYCEDPEYADLDDFFVADIIKKIELNQEEANKYLFVSNETDLNKLTNDCVKNFKPNRKLVKVKAHFFDFTTLKHLKTTILTYYTKDMKLKVGDKVKSVNSKHQMIGEIVEENQTYFEGFGLNSIKNAPPFVLVEIIKVINIKKYDLCLDFIENPITYPKKYNQNINYTKEFLLLKCDEENLFFKCDNIEKLMNSIQKLANEYNNKTKLYYDVARYYHFMNEKNFKSLKDFIIYTVCDYFSLGVLVSDKIKELKL